LHAFQNKVRAQIAQENPEVAADLIRVTQQLLDQIECAENQ
jgi:hypothetical protein